MCRPRDEMGSLSVRVVDQVVESLPDWEGFAIANRGGVNLGAIGVEHILTNSLFGEDTKENRWFAFDSATFEVDEDGLGYLALPEPFLFARHRVTLPCCQLRPLVSGPPSDRRPLVLPAPFEEFGFVHDPPLLGFGPVFGC